MADLSAASARQPWGRDEIGAAFQMNYGPLMQQFAEAFGTVAVFVEGLGDAADQSMQDNLAADDRAEAIVVRSYQA